jgi:hypothetical protein
VQLPKVKYLVRKRWLASRLVEDLQRIDDGDCSSGRTGKMLDNVTGADVIRGHNFQLVAKAVTVTFQRMNSLPCFALDVL